MLKIHVFLVFFISSKLIFAQDIHWISLHGKIVKLKNTGIWVDEIIDAREDTTNIGYVLKGVSNSKMEADLKKGFKKELFDVINSNLRLVDNPILVAIRFRKFEIREETNNGRLELKCDIFIKQKAGFVYVKEIESIQTVKGFDVTLREDNNIVSGLRALFKKIKKVDLSEALERNIFVSRAALNRKSLNEQKQQYIREQGYPFQTEKLQEGFYKGYLDFRNNKPSDDFYIFIKGKINKTGVREVIPFYTKTNKRVKDDFWGFCHGGTVYVLVDKKYFPIEWNDDEITFFGYNWNDPYYRNQKVGGVIIASIFGVTIGGAVGGALIATSVDGAKTKAKYNIDIFNGSITSLRVNQPSYEIEKPAKLVLVRQPTNQSNDDLILNITGKNYIIGLNHSEEVKYDPPFDNMKVCIEGWNDSCLTYLPESGKTKYVVVSSEKPGNSAIVRVYPVATDVGLTFISKNKRLRNRATQ